MHMSELPIWLEWVEPEVVDLTDEELQEYLDELASRAEQYRLQRRSVSSEHPEAYRFAYSAWWCSKRLSIGVREQQRRRI
jgi:hypothetical protein